MTFFLVILLVVSPLVYLALYLRWQARVTAGARYFSLPRVGRLRLRRLMRWHGYLLLPLIALLMKLVRIPDRVSGMVYQGVAAPTPICSEESFRFAREYEPTGKDIFVVTQMKSGTTWMQQIVYELLLSGEGRLNDAGHGHLYAASPWIEANASVALADAPLLGPQGQRLIKTHLPEGLCPFSEDARYIYLVRDPVDCFASCADFFSHVVGPAAPSHEAQLDWFCSDDMFWGPWPEHVAGWWDLAARHDNVLFVQYEALRGDLAGEVDRIARFLGLQPNAAQMTKIQQHCSFEWMSERQDVFEMTAPNLFSVASEGAFLKSGGNREVASRDPQASARIREFCAQRLRGRVFPASRYYPDLPGVADAVVES